MKEIELNPRFFTRSLKPSVECIKLDDKVPTFRNHSLKYWCRAKCISFEELSQPDVRNFVKAQVLIAQEVNDTYETALSAIEQMRGWKGNAIIDEAIWVDETQTWLGVEDKLCLDHEANWTKWMYSDSIEGLLDPFKRRKAKLEARAKVAKEVYLSHLDETVKEYKELNYLSKPYKKKLLEEAGLSRTTVDRYATKEVHYVDKSTSTIELIRGYRTVNPKAKQKDAVEELGLSLPTIKLYWNEEM